jgi:ribose transport system ATP-binding protein
MVNLSVRDNLAMATYDRFQRGLFIQAAKVRQVTEDYIQRLNIRTPSLEQLLRNLSGGNQQKVVIAKWLLSDQRVLIMDEPTRGIDVGSKVEIHRIMRELADRGACVIFISAEVPEIVRVSDRVLVLQAGRVAAEFPRGTSQEEIVHRMLKGNGQ